MKILVCVLLGLSLVIFLVWPLCSCANGVAPILDLDTVSIHTVQYGTMPLHTRGQGRISRVGPDSRATVQVMRSFLQHLKIGQLASVRIAGISDSLSARVVKISKAHSDGQSAVELSFTQALPAEVRGGDSADALIAYGKIENTLYLERGTINTENAGAQVFRLDTGKTATRVIVQFGAMASELIEIKSGLKEGDKLIVSDMSRYDNVNRVQLE